MKSDIAIPSSHSYRHRPVECWLVKCWCLLLPGPGAGARRGEAGLWPESEAGAGASITVMHQSWRGAREHIMCHLCRDDIVTWRCQGILTGYWWGKDLWVSINWSDPKVIDKVSFPKTNITKCAAIITPIRSWLLMFDNKNRNKK